MPRRYIRNNIRTILNVLEYYEVHLEKQMAIMFIDIEKPFDNVLGFYVGTVKNGAGRRRSRKNSTINILKTKSQNIGEWRINRFYKYI